MSANYNDIQMFNDFYRDKRIFLTGHTGFEGCWLTLWLKSLGANVLGYALEPDTDPSMYEEVRLYSHCKNEFGNIMDTRRLNDVMKKFKPEIIINLASQPVVSLGEKNPAVTFQTNVLGAVNVLEAAKKYDCVKAYLEISSGACYANREGENVETDIIGGANIYSASMACKEMMVDTYRKSEAAGKFPIATARGGNAIGGGDWIQDRLIPEFIKEVSVGSRIKLRNPNTVRPFQHILDLLSGYLMLAKCLYENGDKYAQAFNFGANDDGNLTVKDFLQRFINVYGKGVIVDDEKGKFFEYDRLILNSDKAKNLLGWTPTLNIDKTIDFTVEWYKKFYADKDDMFDVTMAQIAEFERLCKYNESNL